MDIKAIEEWVAEYTKREIKNLSEEDWKIIADSENYREDTGEEDLAKKVFDLLRESGILTFNKKDGHVLIGSGVVCNPLFLGTMPMYAYFTQQSDAEMYKKVKYSNARYAVDIAKIL